MWTIFKVFIEFVTMLFLFSVLFFGPRAPGVLAPQPGVEPAPPVGKGKVLTTKLPWKTLSLDFYLIEKSVKIFFCLLLNTIKSLLQTLLSKTFSHEFNLSF